MILFTRLFNFNYVCVDYASWYHKKKKFNIFKKGQDYQRDCWLLLQWKNCKQSLIHFLSTTNDIQTPWKFQFDITQKPNVIWTWNLVRMFIFTWRLLSENKLELRLDPFKECKKANACLFSILRRILLLASAKASRMLSTYHVHVSFLNLIYT